MEFGLADTVLRLFLGLIIGFCMGLTGVGGGVLVLPCLTVILNLPASVSVGTASLYAFLTRTYGAYRHFRLKTIDLRISIIFLLGAVPGNIIVSYLINRYVNIVRENTEALKDFQAGLMTLITAVILVSAVTMIINLFKKSRQASDSTKPNLVQKLKERPHVRNAPTIIMGVVVGSLMGSTSIGGGVLIVPLLIILLGLSPSRTVGTSIFIAAVLTLITSLIYIAGSQVDLLSALIMAAGSMLGVYWGSKLSVKIPEKLLQEILIGVIFVAAILMLWPQ